MKVFIIIIIAAVFALTVASNAHACQIQTIIVNGEMQTWQVCCFPGGHQCQYTRIS
jgi:hypothetical protein